MGIPDHLTCLLRNCMQVRKQQLELDMEQHPSRLPHFQGFFSSLVVRTSLSNPTCEVRQFGVLSLGVWWLGCCQDCVEQVSAWCPVGFWMPPFSLKDFPGEVTCQGARFWVGFYLNHSPWLCYFLIWGLSSSSAASSIGTLSISFWFTLDFPQDFIYLLIFIFFITCPGAEGWVDHSIRSRFPISPWSWGPTALPSTSALLYPFSWISPLPAYLLSSSLAPKVCVFASRSVMSDSLRP